MQAYVGRYLRNVARVLNLFYKDFVSSFVLVLLSQPLVVNIYTESGWGCVAPRQVKTQSLKSYRKIVRRFVIIRLT